MIKEAYVGFEVAKLLKEKGFNESCYGRYSIRSKEFHLDCTKAYNNGSNFMCSAPTHQMAMDWLREKHGFHIYTFYEDEFHWHYVIDSLTKKWRYSVSENKSNDEAIEKALKYSLVNLI